MTYRPFMIYFFLKDTKIVPKIKSQYCLKLFNTFLTPQGTFTLDYKWEI